MNLFRFNQYNSGNYLMQLININNKKVLPLIFLQRKENKFFGQTIIWLPAFIFHGISVASHTCTAYHCGTLSTLFIKRQPKLLKLSLIALLAACILLLNGSGAFAQNNPRQDISLDNDWKTIANDTNQHAFSGFEKINLQR
jgi:hypothetical protein